LRRSDFPCPLLDAPAMARLMNPAATAPLSARADRLRCEGARARTEMAQKAQGDAPFCGLEISGVPISICNARRPLS